MRTLPTPDDMIAADSPCTSPDPHSCGQDLLLLYPDSEPNQDPPPPYPSPRRRTRRFRHLTSSPRQPSESALDHDHAPSSPPVTGITFVSPSSPTGESQSAAEALEQNEEDESVSETTPFLSSRVPRARSRGLSSVSHASSVALPRAPSLAQTCLSLFCTDEDQDDQDVVAGWVSVSSFLMQEEREEPEGREEISTRRSGGAWALFSRAGWRSYFRPMTRTVYYRSFIHLLLVNFPYALIAWVSLFVLTVVSMRLILLVVSYLCWYSIGRNHASHGTTARCPSVLSESVGCSYVRAWRGEVSTHVFSLYLL